MGSCSPLTAFVKRYLPVWKVTLAAHACWLLSRTARAPFLCPGSSPCWPTVLPTRASWTSWSRLGTHPPLNEEELCSLVGLSPAQYREDYSHINLLNHEWDNPAALTELGIIDEDQLRELCGPAWHHSLGGDVPVNLNRAVLEYDHILIVGPSFPHEVVGISGGAKYLFPGISGPQLINKFHWLGALITTMNIIGCKDTPVRDIIHQAAEFLPTPLTLLSLVVVDEGLAGMFIGDHLNAWAAAARLSQQHLHLLAGQALRASALLVPAHV